MGNRADKVSHQSYAEVGGADWEHREHREDREDREHLEDREHREHREDREDREHLEDERRVGVSYIFSTDDDEQVDGPPDRDEDPLDPGNDVLSSVYYRDECVFARSRGAGSGSGFGSGFGSGSADALLRRCAAGDLLEFVGAGRSPHWAVYVGDRQVVHLHRAEVKNSPLTDAGGGRSCRLVNHLYRFRALGRDVVVQNAMEQVGLRDRELSWRNSECFAAWCRFGRREFQMGTELLVPAPYRLRVRVSDRHAHVLEFQSLEDAVTERRRGEQLGRAALIGQLAAQRSRVHEVKGD